MSTSTPSSITATMSNGRQRNRSNDGKTQGSATLKSKLFEPLTIRGTTFPNRLWVAPMCQYSAVDGLVNDWHLVHLGGLAVGGPGLILAEMTGVLPEGRITPDCAGIWSEAHQRAWAPIVEFVTAQGVPIGIQLGHAGRKASTYAPWRGQGDGTVPKASGGWKTLGPTARPWGDQAAPRAMDADDIARAVRGFADGARRAVDAGFNVIELHGAHGYLIHQFLSPLSNYRTDGYGGSAQSRARFAFEVVEGVRAAAGGSVPLVLRLSATDWIPGGLEPEDIAAIAPELETRGVDCFDISSGGNDPRQVMPVAPGYQVPLARTVKDAASVPVTAVGLLTEPAQMEQILAMGDADAIFVGREFLRDRMLARRAAQELNAESVWPHQYRRASPRR